VATKNEKFDLKTETKIDKKFQKPFFKAEKIKDLILRASNERLIKANDP
jgi:hypothetical protein